MTLSIALLATLLALAPCALPAELAESIGRGSRLALAALPYVVLAGVPLASGRESDRGGRGWTLALGLALPVGAVAAWLDLRNGLAARELALTAALALALLALFGEASHRGRGSARHALGWLALVLAGPAAMAACGWAASGVARSGELVRALYVASPITWALGRVRAPLAPDRHLFGLAELAPVAAAFALLALALLAERAPSTPRAEGG